MNIHEEPYQASNLYPLETRNRKGDIIFKLREESNVDILLEAALELQERYYKYSKAYTFLNIKGIERPEFKISGYTFEQWRHDFELRTKILLTGLKTQ